MQSAMHVKTSSLFCFVPSIRFLALSYSFTQNLSQHFLWEMAPHITQSNILGFLLQLGDARGLVIAPIGLTSSSRSHSIDSFVFAFWSSIDFSLCRMSIVFVAVAYIAVNKHCIIIIHLLTCYIFDTIKKQHHFWFLQLVSYLL